MKTSLRAPRSGVKLRLIILLTLTAMVLLGSLCSEALCPYDPYAQDLSIALQPPSAEHLLGTDSHGRDMLSRVLIGSRASIFSALGLVAIIAVAGTLIGVLCAWRGGRTDTVLMRISDLFLAFPSLVFAMAVAGVLDWGLSGAVLALAVIGWPKYARLARGQTLAQKHAPYIAAARLAGCSGPQLMLRHILPNILGPILVTAALDIGTMMMELAALSYLGLGAKMPLAEWGSMMSGGRSMIQTTPWVVLAPGGAILLTVMLFNLLGDTVGDYLDPGRREGRALRKRRTP